MIIYSKIMWAIYLKPNIKHLVETKKSKLNLINNIISLFYFKILM